MAVGKLHYFVVYRERGKILMRRELAPCQAIKSVSLCGSGGGGGEGGCDIIKN